ncbi:MAG TPA: hypothetical protein VEJ63_09340 [Planctomycetota bacterium]|nr:hypothetical protein [Planctomycetota bacterium]
MRIAIRAAAALFAISMVITASGCKRSDDHRDARTLEQRPHTETVRPVDRSDAFRP